MLVGFQLSMENIHSQDVSECKIAQDDAGYERWICSVCNRSVAPFLSHIIRHNRQVHRVAPASDLEQHMVYMSVHCDINDVFVCFNW